eukprot:g3884.t1
MRSFAREGRGGREAAKNLILAGPGRVTLHDDGAAEIKDCGANFYLTPEDVGTNRAKASAPKLQELNGRVKVVVHEGELTEELVADHDLVVFTRSSRDEMIKWNEFCRSHTTESVNARGIKVTTPAPIVFIAADTLGAMGYVFSDFGDQFVVQDEFGEPPVERTVTEISAGKEGIVKIVHPNESELARPLNIDEDDHTGFVKFDEVKGMYAKKEQAIPRLGHSINTSGPWKVSPVYYEEVERLTNSKTKQKEPQLWVYKRDKDSGEYSIDKETKEKVKVPVFESNCGEVKEEDFVLDDKGEKTFRMTKKRDHYSFKIADTTGYSPYVGQGTITQHFQPSVKSHRSLKECLQQPIDPAQAEMLQVDGAKDMLMNQEKLHLAKQAVFKYWADHGALPPPQDAKAADEVVANARQYAESMQGLAKFCGARAAMSQFDKEEPSEEMAGWGMTKSLMGPTDEFTADVESVVRKVAMTAAIELQPMATLFGGIVAQEIVKFGGKFTPLSQWVQIDCLEVLPKGDGPPADCAPVGSRYDNNIMMFGKAVQDKLLSARTFMVGCGALGCEFLKNFAMLGFACGDGCITVTDNDRIEVSNLNRQFLFREHNVGQPKSVAAAESVKLMNPDIKVDSKQLLAMPATEDTFDDDFWEAQNFVTNALDSVKARQYVDGRCVFYGKPLFESGTEGTKFNSMVILPGLTQSYTDGPQDAGTGDAIPMCTLRNFPSTIIHCIEWAKAQFVDLFEAEVSDLVAYLEDPAGFCSSLKAKAAEGANDASLAAQKLRDTKDRLGKGLLRSLRNARIVKDQGFAGCIKLALEVFYDRFFTAIRDLQHAFPKDKVDEKTKKPFWAPPKRYPDALVYGELEKLGEDEGEYSDMGIDWMYVIAVANLYAAAYGLVKQPMNGRDADGKEWDTFVPEGSDWRKQAYVEANMGSAREAPEFRPSGIKIETEEDEAAGGESKGGDEGKGEDAQKFDAAMAELEAMSVDGLGDVAPADFEKDLDLNFHIDFIFAAANLRACNYGIRPAPRHKCKMIAGKIIPAIATSTACATALVGIEILKLIQGDKELADYRGSSNNFAMNTFQMSEPSEVIKFDEPYEDVVAQDTVYPCPRGFSKWDRTVIEGEGLTVGQFIQMCEKQASVTVQTLAHPANAKFGGKMLFNKANESFKEHPNTNHKAPAFRKMAEKQNAIKRKKVEAHEASLKKDLVDYCNELYGGVIGKRKWTQLEGSFKDEEGHEAVIPTLLYKFG